jgi:hypothetical protein
MAHEIYLCRFFDQLKQNSIKFRFFLIKILTSHHKIRQFSLKKIHIFSIRTPKKLLQRKELSVHFQTKPSRNFKFSKAVQILLRCLKYYKESALKKSLQRSLNALNVRSFTISSTFNSD